MMIFGKRKMKNWMGAGGGGERERRKRGAGSLFRGSSHGFKVLFEIGVLNKEGGNNQDIFGRMIRRTCSHLGYLYKEREDKIKDLGGYKRHNDVRALEMLICVIMSVVRLLYVKRSYQVEPLNDLHHWLSY